MKTIMEAFKMGYNRCVKEWKRFAQDRRGSNTLEVVIITAVFVAVALIFRNELMSFVQTLVQTIFGVGDDILGGLS